MIIDRHIAYLLWRDGIVVVPGIGTFTSVRRSAVADDGAVSAPCRMVSFDPHTGADDSCSDSVLARSFARALSLSDDEAAQALARETAELRAALGKEGRVVLAGVGALTVDDTDGSLGFDPTAGVASSWLRPMQARPLAMRSRPEPEAVDAAAEALERRRDSFARILRRTANSAAAIAIFALLVFVVSQLPTRSNSKRQVASLGIENLAAAMPEDPVIVAPGASEPALVLVLNTPADGTAPAKIRSDRRPAAEQSQLPARYCLIVASLASRSEAETFIASHSTTEMPLNLLENEGRWRVYALSAPAIGELSAIARSLGVYDRYPSAWVCRR